MTWIIVAALVYLLIGSIAFAMVKCMDGYNPKKWMPTFILTVFMWPLVLMIWGAAAMVR